MQWMPGFCVRGIILSFGPSIASSWSSNSIHFWHHSANNKSKVENHRGLPVVEYDGSAVPGPADIPLVDGGTEDQIVVILG